MSEPMVEQADLDRLCLEYGRATLRAIVAERLAAERAAEVARVSDRLYKPPAEEGGPT